MPCVKRTRKEKTIGEGRRLISQDRREGRTKGRERRPVSTTKLLGKEKKGGELQTEKKKDQANYSTRKWQSRGKRGSKLSPGATEHKLMTPSPNSEGQLGAGCL